MITEALWEMLFYRPICDFLAEKYGAKFFKLLKPSQQKEVWVGFDQGWANTTLTTSKLFEELKEAIQSQSTLVDRFYFGFFLQFKIVERLIKRSPSMPVGFVPPYFRVKLNLEPSKQTKISQHDTLLRLCRIQNTAVSYACPMIFDIDKIYAPNIKMLRCVPVQTSPHGWTDKEKHAICFRSIDDPKPLWCSDPVEGLSLSFDDWVASEAQQGPRPLNSQETLMLLGALARVLIGTEDGETRELGEFTTLIPKSFVLIEFRKEVDNISKSTQKGRLEPTLAKLSYALRLAAIRKYFEVWRDLQLARAERTWDESQYKEELDRLDDASVKELRIKISEIAHIIFKDLK